MEESRSVFHDAPNLLKSYERSSDMFKRLFGPHVIEPSVSKRHIVNVAESNVGVISMCNFVVVVRDTSYIRVSEPPDDIYLKTVAATQTQNLCVFR